MYFEHSVENWSFGNLRVNKFIVLGDKSSLIPFYSEVAIKINKSVKWLKISHFQFVF